MGTTEAPAAQKVSGRPHLRAPAKSWGFVFLRKKPLAPYFDPCNKGQAAGDSTMNNLKPLDIIRRTDRFATDTGMICEVRAGSLPGSKSYLIMFETAFGGVEFRSYSCLRGYALIG
jgi:hypothetical protein